MRARTRQPQRQSELLIGCTELTNAAPFHNLTPAVVPPAVVYVVVEPDDCTYALHSSEPVKIEADDAVITVQRRLAIDGSPDHEVTRATDTVHLIVGMTMAMSVAETFMNAEQALQLAAALLNHADALDADGGRS